MRAHASRDGLRVRAEAAVDDDADGNGRRGSGGASATGGLRGTTTASSAFTRRPRRASAASAAWRPGRHQGERSSATAEDAAGGGVAGLGALLVNDDVELIFGRGRWGDSWHKIVILNDCGLLHSTNY